MVRASLDTGPIPDTPGWWYRIVDRGHEGRHTDNGNVVGGFVLFEYRVYESREDLLNEKPRFMVNHKAQIRENHLRIKRFGPERAYRHTPSGKLVLPSDIEAFEQGPDYLRYDERPAPSLRNRRATLLPDWTAGDVTIKPYVFEAYTGRDEFLDNQFEREPFAIAEDTQVENLIFRWVQQARVNGLSLDPRIDYRGTVANLAVGASGDDGYLDDDGSAFSSTGTGAAAKINAHSTDSSRRNVWARFLTTGIAQGSTISATTCTLNTDATVRDDYDADIYFENVDSAAAISDTASRHFVNGGSVAFTTGVAWVQLGTGTGDFVVSASLVSDLQEVVDRAGFNTSSNIAIGFLGDTAPDNRDGEVEQYDSVTSEAARLDVTYTAPIAGGTTRNYLTTLGVS